MTILVRELRERASRATPGPWELQTSNSWRRIGTAGGRFADGDVLAPTTHRGDNHPDLAARQEDLDFIVAADPATVLALLNELDQLKAENAELKAQAGKAMGSLTLGIRGKAYDPPGTHRAYTYAEQPDNLGAWRLGEALVEAYRAPSGDHIDSGLGLLKSLQLRGLGVFEMDRAVTKEQP